MFSKVSIKRPVTTIMVLFIVLLCGIVSLFNLNLDLMPNIQIPIAIVNTTYVGAGPEEIETLITRPVEQALATVSKVDTITSTTSSGSSMVMVQFVDGTDIDMAAIDMREKIDMIKDYLPADASAPMVMKIDMSEMSSTVVGVTSDMALPQLTRTVKDKILSRLERIEGIASVDLYGASENEVRVVLNPESMAGYKVTVQQISGLLQSENLNLPAGKIKQGETTLQIRSVGQFKTVEEISELPLTTPTGALIHLRDVADVELVPKDSEYDVRCNGQKGLALQIRKQSNANIVDVSDKLSAELKKIEADYPEINMDLLTNTSDYIKTSVNNVMETAIQAALMAIVILFLFLRSAKSSFIIGVSIPTSVIATFALMYVSDMTLNIISLGGLTIGIGMLVDNSVVVLEAIDRHFNVYGKDARTAAQDGAGEVAMAIAASTLTTVAVFIPLMFVTGMFGQMFKSLSLSVTYSLMASLVVSLTFVPMAYSQMFKYHASERKRHFYDGFLDVWGKGLDAIDKGYGWLLRKAIRHKIITTLIVLVFFFATMSLVPVIGMDLMPAMDQGSASISVEMPKGSPIEKTSAMVDTITEKLGDVPEASVWYVQAGTSSSDTASITFNFVSKTERTRSTDEIAADMRKRLSNIPGVKITVSAASSAMGSFGTAADVQFELTGDDTQELRSIANDLTEKLMKEGWVSDAQSSLSDPVPEASVIIDRARASMYGITSATIANAVSTAITGSKPTTFKVDGDEIDVRIMEPTERTQYVSDLQGVTVPSASGVPVPLTEVATITVQDGATQITRSNQQRYITVSANLVDGIDTKTAQANLEAVLKAYSFPNGYGYQFTGTLESMVETFTSLFVVLLVAILLVYMIMAAQFESLIYPFIIMFSLPVALTGGVLGLYVTGNTITATSFMGFIMLVGMVVNNAIVLVDYANQLRRDGMECDAALIQAGPVRLRPILMTTLTTVIGLVPMALATTEGTEMQQPMAIAIISGMTISTLVTLIFVPVIYSGMEKLHSHGQRKRMKRQAKRIVKVERQNQKLFAKEQRKNGMLPSLTPPPAPQMPPVSQITPTPPAPQENPPQS